MTVFERLRLTRFRVNLRPEARRLFLRLTCSHSHTFTYYLEEATWHSAGKSRGKHPTLLLEGCYLCGRVAVRDYGA